MQQENDVIRLAFWKKSFSLGSRDRGVRRCRRKTWQWAPWLRLACDGRQVKERFRIYRGEFGGWIFRMGGDSVIFEEAGISGSMLAFFTWFSHKSVSGSAYNLGVWHALPRLAVTDIQSHAPSSSFAPGEPLCICANLWKLLLYYQERPSDSSFERKKKIKGCSWHKSQPTPWIIKELDCSLLFSLT